MSTRFESQRWRCAAICVPSRQKANGVAKTAMQSAATGTLRRTSTSVQKTPRPPLATTRPRPPVVKTAPIEANNRSTRRVRAAASRSPPCNSPGNSAWALEERDSEAMSEKTQKTDFAIWCAAALFTPLALAEAFNICTTATFSTNVRQRGSVTARKPKASRRAGATKRRSTPRCRSTASAEKQPRHCAATVVTAAPAMPYVGQMNTSPKPFTVDCATTIRSPVCES
mmetsp:Transcript_103924/g.310389  ORF Transcript_103924/g.310389 Transcript_103924/m.310389 type:complete len:227 (-) Transcript_103924:25-705(-)